MLHGTSIGRYQLVKKIATGGMAEIFLAKLKGVEGFEKEVVIKKLLPHWSGDRDFISMLIDEAKIVVQLNHPNIVQVYELGRDGDSLYMAMEYVNGVDLRHLMQRAGKKRIPLDVALRIGCEILEGLSYAHSKTDSSGRPIDLVHRDISPQNILISFDGTVKVADFGIARATLKTHETATGVLKGKFAYMSPEQANYGEVDRRSDLFAVAVVICEMITGERLFFKGSDIETLDAVRCGRLSFSEGAEKRIPPRLKEILLKALRKDREERIADAASFREELLGFARRSKKNLQREKISRFIRSLFEEESRKKEEEKETVLISKDTAGSGETRTVGDEREILVRRSDILSGDETVELPGTPVVRHGVLITSLRKAKKLRIKKLIPAGLVLAGTLVVWVVWGVVSTPDPSDSPDSQNSPNSDLPVRSAPPSPAEASPVQPSPAEPAPVQPSPVQPLPVAAVPAEVVLPKPPESQAATIPPPEAKVEPPEKKDSNLGKGFLSVQAIPWGYVTVDGARRLETPVRRLPLPAGSHRLKVFYEPDQSTLSSTVKLTADRELVCIANFRDKGIRCD